VTDSINAEIKEMEKIEEGIRRQQEMLLKLLDLQRDKNGHTFAINAFMGKTRSFVTSVSLKWIADNVRFAKDLPIWERNKDGEGRIKIDAETLEELRQREPDWRRQLPMVRYIALREHHKFPPILVVAWKEWVNKPGEEQWIDGHAVENSVTEMPLDSKGTYIDLDCAKTNFYALDGQHRLMAILGLKDLIEHRRIDPRKQDGTLIPKKSITLDEFLQEMSDRSTENAASPEVRIQSLMNESIGIEIIPAVLKGETSPHALMRLRSIFVHVNKTAKVLLTGELALLDEDDGFAIVARRTMVKHQLLKYKRVQTKQGQLRDSAFEYTTLETLVEIAKKYLGPKPEFKRWKIQEKTDLPFRPDDSELDEGVNCLMRYFDWLSELTSHHKLVQDHNKSSADFRGEGDDENILFRPITQIALADAIAILEERGHKPENILQKLEEGEKESKLKLRDRASVWFGVLCDVNQKKMRKHLFYRELCTKMLLHLLGGGTREDEREDLENSFWDARRIDEQTWVGLDGESVKSNHENERPISLRLPKPW